MANAHIVWGKVNYGVPVLTVLGSETVAGGATIVETCDFRNKTNGIVR